MPKKIAKQVPVSDDKDLDQWVMFIPESCSKSLEDQSPSLCKLRHPRTNRGSMFLFSADNKEVHEVLRFNEKYRSWFIGEKVQSDGSIFLPTPIDPIFLALPCLIKASKSGKFMQMDQILEDSEFPEIRRLCTCGNLEHVHQVSDTKGSDDFQVYRYNEDKTHKWLKAKVDRLAGVLQEKKIHTNTTGSCSMTYLRGTKTTGDSLEEILHFAYGMVSEYLPRDLSKSLKNYLGLKDLVHEKPDIEEPNPKRSKKSIVPSEDYSKQNGQAEKKADKNTRATLAQKQLNKVDKTGMKNISSFFSPKPKK